MRSGGCTQVNQYSRRLAKPAWSMRGWAEKSKRTGWRIIAVGRRYVRVVPCWAVSVALCRLRGEASVVLRGLLRVAAIG